MKNESSHLRSVNWRPIRFGFLLAALLVLGLTLWITPSSTKAQQGGGSSGSQQENTNCEASSVTTNSCSGGSVTLIAPTNTPSVCIGSGVNISVTSSNILGQMVIDTSYSNCPDSYQTNSVSPTIVSSTWTASGPGSFTASGSGLSASFTPTNGGSGTVTFNTTYQDGCDTNNQTTSPVSANYNVIQITNQCVATTPANRARTTIGVGEQVNLWLVGSPSGTFTWSTSAGSVSPTTGTSTTLTAPSNSATATITVSYSSGSCTLPFSVIAPSGYIAVKNSTVGSLGINIAGTGMYIDLWLAPTNVSFGAVTVMEVGKSATNITGYFTLHPPPSHVGHGADNPVLVGMDNRIGQDTASSSGWPQPWSNGSFTWPIPALWWVSGSSSNSLPWSDQVFTIDASGTMTITKFGHTVTRNTNDVYTTFN